MIILRRKSFAVPQTGEMIDAEKSKKFNPQPMQSQPQPQPNPPEVTSKDLQIEQMRLQKQQQLIQHQKAKLQVQEGMTKLRATVQRQRMVNEKKQRDFRNMMEIHKEINDENVVQNPTLYKSRPSMVAPVAMPK